jgi:hypothetical protein
MTEKSSRSLPASPKDAKGIRDFWSQKSFSLHRRAKDAFKTKKDNQKNNGSYLHRKNFFDKRLTYQNPSEPFRTYCVHVGEAPPEASMV